MKFASELEAAHRLSTHTGGSAVRVLELHAAPLADGDHASVSALTDSLYGPAWADVHVPPAPPATDGNAHSVSGLSDVLERASLMTAARIGECLEAAGTDPRTGFRGIKVAARPHATVDERVAVIAQTLAIARQRG